MPSYYVPQYSTREHWHLFLRYGVPLIAWVAALQ